MAMGGIIFLGFNCANVLIEIINQVSIKIIGLTLLRIAMLPMLDRKI